MTEDNNISSFATKIEDVKSKSTELTFDKNKNLNAIAKELLEVDELKMYMGDDFYINDNIVIKQPTIGQISEFGERKYYSMVHMLTCIPSDMKSQLDDIGINYMDISDFELFIMLTRELTKEDTFLLLGDLDLSTFVPCIDQSSDQLVLYNETLDIKIDTLIYVKLVEYIRRMHCIKPKIENAANEYTRKLLIQLDRQEIKKNKNKPYKSQLKGLISAMMRYPGFKYKKNELRECGLYEFMDTVQGAQIYISATSLLAGSYSGMLDVSKIQKKEFNWLRDSNE